MATACKHLRRVSQSRDHVLDMSCPSQKRTVARPPEPPKPAAMCTLAIFDQVTLAEQIEQRLKYGCSGCSGRRVKLVGSTPKGIGAWTLDFTCMACEQPWDVQRSKYLPQKGPGAPTAVNTQLMTSSLDMAGVGFSQASAIMAGADMDPPAKGT